MNVMSKKKGMKMSRKPKFMQNQSLYNNKAPIPVICFKCYQSGVLKERKLLVCGYEKYKACKKVRDEFKIPNYFSYSLDRIRENLTKE